VKRVQSKEWGEGDVCFCTRNCNVVIGSSSWFQQSQFRVLYSPRQANGAPRVIHGNLTMVGKIAAHRQINTHLSLIHSPVCGPSKHCSIMATEVPPKQDEKRLFEDIDAYPWDTDTEFQVSDSAIYG
jgi:hypothetical protein